MSAAAASDSFTRVGYAYRPALDGVRALAVVTVVAYHLDGDVLPGGFLGVDVFFVLSGYLIAGLLLAEQERVGRIGLAGFWVRRARRLLPALGGVLAAVAAYAHWWAPTDTLDRLRTDAWATVFYVANWRFAFSDQSYVATNQVESALKHAWSLAVEEQFYILFPLLVMACCRGRRPARTLGVVSAIGAVASALAMAVFVNDADPSFVYYSTHTRAHALLIGVVLACFGSATTRVERRSHHLALQSAGVIGLVAVLVAGRVVDFRDEFMYRGGFFVVALAVAAVIAAAVRPGIVQRILAPAPLRWIGQRSYGIYLWHWPTIVALEPARTGLEGWRLAALRLVVTLVATVVSYRLIETPIRTGALRGLRFTYTSSAVAGVLVVALFVATTGSTTPSYAIDTNIASVRPEVLAPVVEASSDSVAATTSTMPTSSTDTAAVRFRPRTVAIIGDSVPASAMTGFRAEAAARGMGLVTFVVPGCGVAIGGVADEGRVIEWTKDCPDVMASGIADLVRNHDPDVILWWSGWETADRVVGDDIAVAGTSMWSADLDAMLEARWEAATAGGARVVLVDTTPNAASPVGEADRDPEGRIVALRDRLHELAERHPTTTAVVEFSNLLCPNGVPCPREIGGVTPRPDDGGHFTEATARWAIERLWPLAEQAWSGFAA